MRRRGPSTYALARPRMRPYFLVFALVLILNGCATLARPRDGESIHRNLLYAAHPGKRLHLDLYVPASPRPAPLIVWIHGGGWKYGDKGYHLSIRELTDRGYAIASVQYRLLWHAPWPAQIADCEEAIAWLRQNGGKYGI